jgi:fructose-1,6-bisphosphatase/sedoheptulose 1,7-bisphosphatase-like protein
MQTKEEFIEEASIKVASVLDGDMIIRIFHETTLAFMVGKGISPNDVVPARDVRRFLGEYGAALLITVQEAVKGIIEGTQDHEDLSITFKVHAEHDTAEEMLNELKERKADA